MVKDLASFFSPKSVAIIGASQTPGKIGTIVLQNIINSKFRGEIYPVNPNYENINNLKCYKDVTSLPVTPDLAVLAVPALAVYQVIAQIGEKEIKNVVVFAAGFKEIGEEGVKLEKELAEIVNKYNINLLGPNCLGFINNLCPINTTFAQSVEGVGNLRFISQSGAIAASLFDFCKTTGLSFNQFITLGNKTNINENDILEYLQQSLPENSLSGLSKVYPIGLYLESISDGPKFFKLLSEISKTNPIFIIKPGKTPAAAKAMQSHTGAIAGQEHVLQVALAQSGVIRCQTLEDFFDMSKALAFENAPLGKRIAIISNAGGPAVISSDAVILEGLELAQFNDDTKNKLLEILPRSASIINPIDVLGDALALRFEQAGEIILATNQADALLFILTPQIMTETSKTAEIISNLSEKYQKPIFCSFIGGSSIKEGQAILDNAKIPSFPFPERAIAAISKMWKWRQYQQKSTNLISATIPNFLINTGKIKEIISQAILKNQTALDNLEADNIAKALELSTPATSLVNSLEESCQFAKENNYPVVLKLSSASLLHKKKVGGVVMDIRNEEQLEVGWDTLQRKIVNSEKDIQSQVRIQIQKEINSGIEVIVGVKNDPTFGKVILFGAGGSLAELVADRNLHLLPIDLLEAEELVEKSKVMALLKNQEGEVPLPLNKLYEVILKLGKLALENLDISDIEINPLIITSNNVWAVDTKVILKKDQVQHIKLPPFQQAQVVKRKDLISTFHYFDFTTPQPLLFQPGQHISIKVSPERINCYSIAGRDGPNKFNLLIDTKTGGLGSKFFSYLQGGNKISYLGPVGNFTLKTNDGAKHMVFLATGSGLAPLKCMIESMLKERKSSVPITLYWGLSKIEDLFWQDYLQKLSLDYPNFNAKIVIYNPSDKWHGRTGFITSLLEEDFEKMEDFAAYLCGNKNMIADASEILLRKKCPKERIYTEKY